MTPQSTSLPSESIRSILNRWESIAARKHVLGYVKFLQAHLCIAVAIERGGSQSMVAASRFVVARLELMNTLYSQNRLNQLPPHWQIAFGELRANRFKDDVVYMMFGFAHLTIDLQDAIEQFAIPEAEFFADTRSLTACSKRHMPGDSDLRSHLSSAMATVSVQALRTFYFYRARQARPADMKGQFYYHLGSAAPEALTAVVKQIVQNPELARTLGLLK